jgi:hypothetical protein
MKVQELTQAHIADRLPEQPLGVDGVGIAVALEQHRARFGHRDVPADCHALYDVGMLPIMAEYVKGLRAGGGLKATVSIPTVLSSVPFVIAGITLVLIAGLWSLRSAIRRAAADDPITADPRHQTIVRRWRWSANTLLVLGGVGLIGAIAYAVLVESPQTETPDLPAALNGVIGFAAAIFALIVSWVLRQSR